MKRKTEITIANRKNKMIKSSKSIDRFIPLDILIEILSRLPSKSLIKLCAICKSWCSLITNPNFATLHHEKTSPLLIARNRPYYNGWIRLFNFVEPNNNIICCKPNVKFPELGSYDSLSNSVNGLICGYDIRGHKQYYYLINPTTRELVPLPGASLKREEAYECTIGFGFDSSIGIYKLALIFRDYMASMVCSCMVLTVGSGQQWRYVNSPPSSVAFIPQTPVFSKGLVYWKATLKGGTAIILAFNLKEEKFRVISTPHDSIPTRKKALSIISDNVFLTIAHETFISIWMLKDCKNQEWSITYRIDFSNLLKKLTFACCFAIKGDKLLLYSKDMDMMNIIHYHPRRKTTEICTYNYPCLGEYKESIVSPKRVISVDDKS